MLSKRNVVLVGLLMCAVGLVSYMSTSRDEKTDGVRNALIDRLVGGKAPHMESDSAKVKKFGMDKAGGRAEKDLSTFCSGKCCHYPATGHYVHGNLPFSPCAVNAAGEGFRGGYSLPGWNHCVVGYGGHGYSSSTANCVDWNYHYASSGTNCATTCSNHGKSAVTTGSYIHGGAFYYCAGNFGNEGFRGGYNLHNGGFAHVCVSEWGGRETSLHNFICFCK